MYLSLPSCAKAGGRIVLDTCSPAMPSAAAFSGYVQPVGGAADDELVAIGVADGRHDQIVPLHVDPRGAAVGVDEDTFSDEDAGIQNGDHPSLQSRLNHSADYSHGSPARASLILSLISRNLEEIVSRRFLS